MKHVDIREFEARPARYLFGKEPVTVERDGHSIGYYLPSRAGQQASRKEALDRLGETVERILAETGWTEDEFADLLDPSKPFEEQLERLEMRRKPVAAGADAARD